MKRLWWHFFTCPHCNLTSRPCAKGAEMIAMCRAEVILNERS